MKKFTILIFFLSIVDCQYIDNNTRKGELSTFELIKFIFNIIIFTFWILFSLYVIFGYFFRPGEKREEMCIDVCNACCKV